jgi:adenylate cyclase
LKTVLRQFLTELRRRRVIRVLVLYAIAGWIIVQVASTVLPGLHVPQWSVTLVIVLVALGLPLAAVLAWAFDVGDDGLKRTPAEGGDLGVPVTPSPLPASSSGPTGLPSAGAAEQPTATERLTGTPTHAAVPSVARHDGDRRSIAVLPFANLTGDPGKDYLGEGLAEELIHTLARVPGLHVPSRTSSFAYRVTMSTCAASQGSSRSTR